MMFNQPFYVSECLVLVCNWSLIVSIFDPREPSLTVRRVVLPVEHPYWCSGVDANTRESRFLVADLLGSRLLLLDAGFDLVCEFALPCSLSPVCVTRTHERFWFALQYDDFHTRLGWLDEGLTKIHLPSIEDGSDSTTVHFDAHVFLLSHHEELVVLDPYAGKLSWLDETCRLTRSMKVPPGVIVGPCTSGDLVCSFSSDPKRQMCIIDSSANIVPLHDLHVGSWKETIGLCMTSECVFALDGDDVLHVCDRNSGCWRTVRNLK
jgi:hypothetical protein